MAEDEPDVAELVRHHLIKDEYDVVPAKTGAAGTPVIMVSGRVEEGDKVLGFELGADHYVTKPFSPRELLARIRAVARRRQGGEAAGKRSYLKSGGLEIDCERFEVRVAGRTVDVHMARLRSKFLSAKVELPGVETVRGVGYRFREPEGKRS